MGRRAADCWLWMMKLLSSAPANSTRTSYSNKAGARSPSSHTPLPFMSAHSPGSPGEKWIWIKRADIKQCRGQAARDWAGDHLGGATHSDLDDQKMQKNVTTKNIPGKFCLFLKYILYGELFYLPNKYISLGERYLPNLIWMISLKWLLRRILCRIK